MTTILAMSSYFKGDALLRECHNQGARLILLTTEKLANDPWPREHIDEVFLMPDITRLPDVIYGVAYLMRSNKIERIIPLDEYDVETAALLREHLRVPGMGISQTKRFRDKLIMRETAQAMGFRVPRFSPVVHHDDVRDYMESVPPPWVLKPRLEAGAMGIKRVNHPDELWHFVDILGDEQSYKVLEEFVPGDVYHVDALTVNGETVFSSVQKYGKPPLNVSHDGGIFTTVTVPPDHADAIALTDFNKTLIAKFGLTNGPTHAEFIKSHATGEFYFLEIAARVGGAHIADLIEHTTGINLWAEWAKLEIAQARGEDYTLPAVNRRFGGLLVCLAKQEYPDMSGYNAPEIAWKIDKKQHAGLIVAAEDADRVQALVSEYTDRFVGDFLAVAPPLDKPDH